MRAINNLIKAILKVAVTLMLGSLSDVSLAQDWYVSAGSDCSGSTALNTAVATFLPKGLSLKAIAPAGNFVVQITPTELASYTASNPYLLSQASIDGSNASSLRAVFKLSTEKVPFLFKITNAFFLNYALPNVPLNVAAGALFEYFYQNVEAEAVFIENATGYVAAGGKLAHLVSVRKSQNGGRFLLSQLAYSVPVGAESRSFILGVCQFPIAIAVTEFQTTGQFNNKIIKPQTENIWGVFDLDGNKWDSLQLRYVRQEVDYLVFESDEIENIGVVGKTTHRLSLVGGPWSRKRSDAGSYANLYLNINAK